MSTKWKRAVDDRQALLNAIWDEIVLAGMNSAHPDGRLIDIVESVRLMREELTILRANTARKEGG